ncbi:hypothetical protein, partial [Burkholderia gladioli]|uniref:hypothetical protein n=1 Tax=Burkholderia gladioli TaxID=28095 RepID=UPI00236390D3
MYQKDKTSMTTRRRPRTRCASKQKTKRATCRGALLLLQVGGAPRERQALLLVAQVHVGIGDLGRDR